jgi:hypothetical protein
MDTRALAPLAAFVLCTWVGVFISSRSVRLLSAEERTQASRLPISVHRLPWLLFPGPLLGLFLPLALALPLALVLVLPAIYLIGASLLPLPFPTSFRNRFLFGWSLQCLSYFVGGAYLAHIAWLIRLPS